MMALNKELVAPCGIHCAPCPLFLAQTDEELARALARRMNAPVEKISCPGCRPAAGSPTPLRQPSLFRPGTESAQTNGGARSAAGALPVCSTYACAESQGVHTCAECPTLPCERLAPSHERAERLPHNTKLFSLLVLRRDGYERWAQYYPRLQQLYFKGRMAIGAGPHLEE